MADFERGLRSAAFLLRLGSDAVFHGVFYQRLDGQNRNLDRERFRMDVDDNFEFIAQPQTLHRKVRLDDVQFSSRGR